MAEHTSILPKIWTPLAHGASVLQLPYCTTAAWLSHTCDAHLFTDLSWHKSVVLAVGTLHSNCNPRPLVGFLVYCVVSSEDPVQILKRSDPFQLNATNRNVQVASLRLSIFANH